MKLPQDWMAPFLVLAASLSALLAPAGLAAPGPDPLTPASSGGLAALDRALARLATHKRLLMIAAHPDDEDTRLLTYVSSGLGGEAAYLSLSRGEGGQNLIGPELGVGLGLLRSRELLAARGVDGSRQFFTRAYDFGYTRSLEETLELWPKEVLLEDAVRVIRRFKPQVLAAVFPPTAQAGHGQHWASGLVAQEAFDLAADPNVFVDLAQEGLAPWTVKSFFRSSFFDRSAASLEVPLGTLEPFTGRSIFQISMLSRSQHRCQDMGFLLPLGDANGALTWQKGVAGPEADDLFAGVDTRPSAIAEPLPPGELRRSVAERLERMGELAQNARRHLNAVEPGSAVEPLLEIVRLLTAVDRDLAAQGSRSGPHRQVRDLVQEKWAIAQEALATAAGVLADAFTDRETVVPGERFPVRAIFWNAGNFKVDGPERSVLSDAGWRSVSVLDPPPSRSFFASLLRDEKEITVEVPATSPETVPYFLRRPRNGALYDWSTAAAEDRGRPFGKAPLAVRFSFEIEGVPVRIEREVVYRYRDQARGEIRRPVRAVPRLEVSVEPEVVVWPIGDRREASLRVVVRSNVAEKVVASLEVALPPGWPALDLPDIEIDEPHGQEVRNLTLSPGNDFKEGRYEVRLAAKTRDGARFGRSFPLVDYEHIRPTPMPEDAHVRIAADEIRFPRGRIGYIRGASDRVPEFLAEIGVAVEVLSAENLLEDDLSRFRAIVVGSRAYEADRSLGRFNGRLLEYAAQGGLLIVQYQQYQFVQGSFAPYKIEIRRPHDRVTDETAPVRTLSPEHPVWSTPNRITEADWQGWVQERGLYFAGTWDERYEALLAMADPGGEEKRGALLVARHGKGHYVYTGLAFFRQIPAGVTGAYRIFANLLALGHKSEEPGSAGD